MLVTWKRVVLCFLCSIFDPLGFLNFCLLETKLLIQDLWKKKLNWEDLLPCDLRKKWKYIQENFNYVYKLSLHVSWFQLTKKYNRVTFVFWFFNNLVPRAILFRLQNNSFSPSSYGEKMHRERGWFFKPRLGVCSIFSKYNGRKFSECIICNRKK